MVKSDYRILVTGNLGYVGSVLIPYLRANYPKVQLIGFDKGIFSHLLTGATVSPDVYLDEQYYGDVRAFPKKILENVDCVIHLAAISNDPMGNIAREETLEINHVSSIKIAKEAHKLGVKNFIFASSCSIYGKNDKGARNEDSPTNPLTPYALSKLLTEQDLLTTDLKPMQITCLRFATACGMSRRLRLDLVLNDFTASAYLKKEIEILSDGSPWRPIIDVQDMCSAIEWAMKRKKLKNSHYLSVNVGKNEHNFQIKQLANSVSENLERTNTLIAENASRDDRSYKVDFSLFEKIAPKVIKKTINQTINELIEGFQLMNFNDENFRNSDLIRLNALQKFNNTTSKLD